MDTTVTQRIDQIFALWQLGECPGGQVAVRQKGTLVYDKCFGYADLEHQLPVTDRSVFHVASVSKQLTVMAVMLLHEDGLLNIDHDIRDYIPEHIAFSEPVTVRDLMNNVSGIRDIWELQMLRGVRIDDTITQKDAVRIIANQRALNFEPRTQYRYSNSNFVLLAEIAEKVSGLSLNDFLQARVFRPLGMESTVIRDRYWQRIDNRAVSFHDNGSAYFHHVLNYGSYGSTSLHTTAHDFLRWMDTFSNPTVCKPETIGEMFVVPKLKGDAQTSYAGGLMLGDLGGHRYIEHGGADASFRSVNMHFPEDELDIVILANTAILHPGTAARAIARILLGLDAPAEPDGFCDDAFRPEDAPGTYYAIQPDGSMIVEQVYEKDGTLYLTDLYEDAPLTHVAGNEYRAGHSPMRLFLGNHAGFVLNGGRVALTRHDTEPENDECLLAYEGRYESEEVETAYTVYAENGALFIDHFRNGRQRLLRLSRDCYLAPYLGTLTVRFTRGSGDRVIGLSCTSGRVLGLNFSKAE